MIEEMRMRRLAPKTRDAYIRAVLHFTRFLGRLARATTGHLSLGQLKVMSAIEQCRSLALPRSAG